MTDVRRGDDDIVSVLGKQARNGGQNYVAVESMSVRRWDTLLASLRPQRCCLLHDGYRDLQIV